MPRKIRIITVGKIREAYLLEGIAEYEKRLRPYAKIEFLQIKDSAMEKESAEIGKHISKNTYVLDVLGKPLSSEQFAGKIKSSAEPITFIIGGPFGISEEVKKKADLISLSSLTFTHEMCALFLIEQIYRAFQINSGRPYHK